MIKGNICPECKFAIPQARSGLGLVDCPKKGCGNAYQTKYEHFGLNENLLKLKETAIQSIKEFERL